MAGTMPEGARPLLEEIARRAKEALQPVIEDATRRVTAELMLRDVEAAKALAGKVREAITAEFWSHPINMASRVAPGTDVGPAMGAMAAAAVDVFAEFLRNQITPPSASDGN